MNGIFTNNLKSITEKALNLYENTPNMVPGRDVLHSAFKLCLLGSIPAALGQDSNYGITQNEVILASVLSTIGLAGAAVGIVYGVYCCLQRSTLDEPGLMVLQDDEPALGRAVIRSIDPDHVPRIRNIFDEPSEQARLQDQLEPSTYNSITTQTISTQSIST